MSKKLDDISKKLNALKKPATAQTGKSEKSGTKHQGAPYIKKGGNGGIRPGGIKPALPAMERRKTLKRAWDDFANEDDEVIIKQLEKGNVVQRRAKMKRLRVIQEAVYKKAKLGDVNAIREFNNRVYGHPKQPIVGDDEEAPVQVDLGVGRILDGAYGTNKDAE